MPTLEELQSRIDQLTTERDAAEEERKLTAEELARAQATLRELDYEAQSKERERLIKDLNEARVILDVTRREADATKKLLSESHLNKEVCRLRRELANLGDPLRDIAFLRTDNHNLEKKLQEVNQRLQTTLTSSAALRKYCSDTLGISVDLTAWDPGTERP